MTVQQEISYYNTKINNTQDIIQENVDKIVNCLLAKENIESAKNGVIFMCGDQYNYTKTSSEKAYHFNDTYYKKLELIYSSYITDLDLILSNIQTKIEGLQEENQSLSNNIEDWYSEIAYLRR